MSCSILIYDKLINIYEITRQQHEHEHDCEYARDNFIGRLQVAKQLLFSVSSNFETSEWRTFVSNLAAN